jgi:hypothetical protein
MLSPLDDTAVRVEHVVAGPARAVHLRDRRVRGSPLSGHVTLELANVATLSIKLFRG